MSRVLLPFILCASLEYWPVFAQAPKERAPEQQSQESATKALTEAGSLLEAAGLYLDLGDKEAAEARVLEALKLTQTQGLTEAARKQITEDVKKLLERIGKAKQAAANKAKEEKATTDERTRQKHRAQIQEAEYQLSQGKASEASKLIQGVLNETDDAEVRKQANDISGRINSIGPEFLNTLWSHGSKIIWWLIDLFLVGLVLLVLYAGLKKLRKRDALKHQEKNKWIVRTIEDKTDLGVGGAIIESLNRWKETRRPASSGLLKLDGEMIPTMPIPRRFILKTDLDLATALSDLKLDVGGISIAGLAKAAGSIRGWFTSLRPSISGSAAISGEQVIVQLTRQTADDTRNSVTASAAKARIADAIEAASFKMYYLIATNTTVSKAESADKLRAGMAMLREFLSGKSPEKLKQAYETFHDVQIENPAFDQAYLYEGIALDLLERHDDAIRTFQHLASISPDLKGKARYNEAVSLFRKYEPAELEKAILIFDELVGLNPTVKALAASPPIMALAYAAKANAIAHRPIFWQQIFYKSVSGDQQVVLKRKSEKKELVLQWVTEVEQIANHLKQVFLIDEGRHQDWDEITRGQLGWATENALGNAYVNYAKSFLGVPHIEAKEAERQQMYLEMAYTAFEKCEMLMPPGVETLANLGTVLIELSRGAEARKYLERAIALNPQYEYAYYRIAESWEQEKRIPNVVDTLRSFAKIKTAKIPEFKKLYQKYSALLSRT